MPLYVPAPTTPFAYKPALYYGVANGGTGVQSFAAGTATVCPMPVSKQVTIDRVGIEVTTLGASATARLAVYNDTGDNYPGTMLLDAGSVSCATTGAKEATVSQVLPVGLYWIAVLPLTAAVGMRRVSATAPTNVGGESLAIAASQFVCGYQTTGLSVLPATWTATVSSVQNVVKGIWRAV